MPEIDPVILQLVADNKQYIASLKSTTQSVDRLLGSQEARVKRLEREMRASSGRIGGDLRRLAGTLATYFTGRELVGLIDSFTRFQNQLKVAGLEGEHLAQVQERLRSIGAQYGVELEALANVFNRATLAQNELGASTEQIIRLNEIVAASLKVAGTSSQEASGALLQLSQALGSGVVRAEEFNSILEGALPLAQAAARGIDGMEGSVAKLRAAVVAGEITSRQFFEGILKGGVDTIKQAENATLTLSGAFTALRNELTLYVGDAAKTSGVTEALAIGIRQLADNLDTVINALAVIAIAMGGRYIAGAVAASTATRALVAHLQIATTSLAGTALAARSAGAALLAAFGGPVGVAITAVTLGLIYYSSNVETASEKTRRFSDRASEAGDKAEAMEGRLRAAGIEVKNIGDAADKASDDLGGFGNVINDTITKLADLAKQAEITQLRLLGVRRLEIQGEINRIGSNQGARSSSIRNQTRTGDALSSGVDARIRSAEATQLKALGDEDAAILRQMNAIIQGMASGVNVLEDAASPGSASTSSGTDKKKKGPSAADIAERFNNELAGYAQQALSAMQSTAKSAEERAEYELRGVELARVRTLASIEADADYSDAQKARLKAQVEGLSELEREAIEFNKRREIEQGAQDVARQRYDNERDALEYQYDLAETQQERKDIALELLGLEERYQRSLLKSIIASETAAKADKERAEIALEGLERTSEIRRASVDRQNQTDVERYLRFLNPSVAKINENIDAIKIDGLEALNDGLVEAIMGAKSLGDVFTAVADQIIADLIRIAIQQAIIQPLAGALFGGIGGGGGGGGIAGGFSTIGNLFGRASGGYVAPGQAYRVNEAAAPGRVEGFMSRDGGKIIPLGQMNAMQPQRDSGGISVVRLELSGDIDARIERVSGGVAVEVVRASAPALVDASANEAIRRAGRPRL